MFLSDDIKKIIRSITSCFENSTPVVQYGYIEALGDGRGYTAGSAGFTTGTGDLIQVLKTYQTLSPSGCGSVLLGMFPLIEKYSQEESGSIRGLQALPDIWKNLSRTDPHFNQAQDIVSDSLYMNPALHYADEYNVKTNLGAAILYDTIIQHGDGDDGDSFKALHSRMKPGATYEGLWLYNFLEARRADLMNPVNKDTTEEWRGSVDRVSALERLLDSNNMELKTPFDLHVFGDLYLIG